jgi:K+ transporter
MQERDAKHPGGIAALGFAALGVVFGDIGTSPLYTLKTVLDLTGEGSATAVLGVLSLIVWTLIAITTIKYVTIAMRVDNDGEGGILALMALLGVKRQRRPAIVALGLFGAALIYGDGAITRAISVLSALEGLTLAAPGLGPYVVPMAVGILVALFAIQSQGTARIGRAFGPVMAAWFGAIALLGVWGIAKHPGVLVGLDPRYAVSYLAHEGFKGFAVLGGVFLCVTGAEALYADMGHFGAKPIRLAWSAIVFPSLVLNYAGQAAIVRRHRRQHLLPALPGTAPAADDHPCDDGNGDCEPIHHHRGIFHDTSGHPVGLVSAAEDHPNISRRLRTDLRRSGELDADGRDHCAHHWVRQIRQPRRRVWHRGVSDDADDLGPAANRHARNLAMEPPC